MSTVADKRIGRQTPTTSVVLPYTETFGPRAVELYEQTGREAQEWQRLMVYDIMATNDDGLWTHTKFGYEIPRRNGKGEIIVMLELDWLINDHARTLHTAHRVTTSHSAWERLCQALDELGYEEVSRPKQDEVYEKAYKATKLLGLETIEILGQKGIIAFRTRSGKGGLGEGYDRLVVDEAQEYQNDHESALKYVVSDSKNPQTILCGTPPTAVSSGTIFPKLREAAIYGEAIDTGWAEWSAEGLTEDVHNRDLWYETNPSLGTILTERKILAEISGDTVDFCIQRLGVWVKYNQKSAISKAQWDELKLDGAPVPHGKLFLGIKFARDGSSVAASIAVKLKDHIFVECLDCQSTTRGTQWLLNLIRDIDTDKIVIDGAGNQQILAEAIKEAKMKPSVVLPSVKEIVTANAAFENAVNGKTLRHSGQPSVVQIASNCEKRPIGTGGGFGYKSISETADVAILDSIILAHWLCATAKERRKQTARY